jgi:hypothetical protein
MLDRVKKAKLPHTTDPLQCKPADLVGAITPALEYDPLPLCDNYRQPIIELPPNTNTDLYSLFILFLAF